MPRFLRLPVTIAMLTTAAALMTPAPRDLMSAAVIVLLGITAGHSMNRRLLPAMDFAVATTLVSAASSLLAMFVLDESVSPLLLIVTCLIGPAISMTFSAITYRRLD